MSSDKKDKPPADAFGISTILSEFSASKVIASEAPEWLTFIQGDRPVMGIPFSGSTYEEMVQFILGDTGITDERFGATSFKSLYNFFEEISRRDVNLVLTHADRPRVIDRFSNNAVGIIYDSRTWEGLHELGRVIIESGSMLLHPEPLLQGCRETALRKKPMHVPGRIIYEDELPLITFIRGMIQEPGVAVHELDIIPLTTTRPLVVPRESSVYFCEDTHDDGVRKLVIRSNVASYKFGYDIAQQGLESFDEWPDFCRYVIRDGDLFLIEDEGVLLYYGVMPIKEGPDLELLKTKHREQYEQ